MRQPDDWTETEASFIEQEKIIEELKVNYNKAVSIINELKASVNDLRDSLGDFDTFLLADPCYLHSPFCLKVRGAIDRTPFQSLQSVKAAEIERVRNEIMVASYNAELDQDDIINYLEKESIKLREDKQ